MSIDCPSRGGTELNHRATGIDQNDRAFDDCEGAGFPRLLDVTRCFGTPDADLRHLSGLANLELLVLFNTQVTNAGTDELRSQLPGCRTVLSPPPTY